MLHNKYLVKMYKYTFRPSWFQNSDCGLALEMCQKFVLFHGNARLVLNFTSLHILMLLTQAFLSEHEKEDETKRGQSRQYGTCAHDVCVELKRCLLPLLSPPKGYCSCSLTLCERYRSRIRCWVAIFLLLHGSIKLLGGYQVRLQMRYY